MATLTLRAYGRNVSLRGPTGMLRVARESLPPSYRETVGPAERSWVVRKQAPGWKAQAEGEQPSNWSDLDSALRAALSDMELWVAEQARARVFLHAGCVAVDGRTILLPGRSMSGKTSLTAALVRAGATYYSDEYAILDHAGKVRPYARPLSFRPFDGGPAVRIAPTELGGPVGVLPAAVGLIAHLRFDAAAGWRTDSVTPGAAALHLIDNAVAARSRPRAVLDAVSAALDGAQCIAGTRGDADEAAARLLEMASSKRITRRDAPRR